MNKKLKEVTEHAKEELAKTKNGAAWLSMINLSSYVKFSGIAESYFKKSPNFVLQRLHGYEVNGKKATFKPDEYQILIEAYRNVAAKLLEAADNIEKAE